MHCVFERTDSSGPKVYRADHPEREFLPYWIHSVAAAAKKPFLTTGEAMARGSLKWHGFAPSRACVTIETHNAALHSGRLPELAARRCESLDVYAIPRWRFSSAPSPISMRVGQFRWQQSQCAGSSSARFADTPAAMSFAHTAQGTASREARSAAWTSSNGRRQPLIPVLQGEGGIRSAFLAGS